MIHDNISVNQLNHLTFAGCDTLELAARYGTPCMLIDENKIRENIKTYVAAMREFFPNGSRPYYASKALSFCELLRIVNSEGIGVDCVSPGEIATAIKAGVPAAGIAYHSNNKTDSEIQEGISMGVGCFVVDSYDELEAISAIAVKLNKIQDVLLRITPGIDPHTHRAISTGNIDSKFGFAVITGQALKATKHTLRLNGIRLQGFHCHIGSQIFEAEPYCEAVDKMIEFIASVKSSTGYFPKILDLGGGFGVSYTDSDSTVDIRENISIIAAHLKKSASIHGIKISELPSIVLEPGRSIVANAGMTLYTVGSVKEIPNFRNYVSVNGGMTDNPRYALYQSVYKMIIADRANDTADYVCTVAGRCCESGDLLGENVFIQRPSRNDTLAVCVTGAYNYSMASNYNRVARPPIIIIKNGKTRIGVRRENSDDIIRLDM